MLPYLILAVCLGVIYGPQVAPRIGTGASGMITAAIAAGGLGPVPNYPVHNAFSKLVLLLPFQDPAHAVNWASFLLAVGAVVLMTALVIRLSHARNVWTVLITGLFISWMYFAAPGLARISYFGDRYTADLFFVVLAANVLLMNLAAPGRALPWLAFLGVLQFFVHPKSLPIAALFFAVALFHTWLEGVRLPWKKMLLCGMAGLLPLLYLPAVSLTDPLFDWGNPENLTNIWRSLTRREYAGLPVSRTWSEVVNDGARQYRYLGAQFPPGAWLMVAAGAIFLWRKNRRWFALAAAFIVVSGDGTTALIHWPFYSGVRGQMGESYMLSYYGPYFAGFIFLAAFGLAWLQSAVPQRWRTAAACVCLAVVLGLVLRDRGENSEAGYAYTAEMTGNFEQLLPEGAILFTNTDGLFAPLVHNQIHNGRLKNRAVVHLDMLFRSWYYDDLERLYPEIWHRHEYRFNALRNLLRSFEASGFDEKKLKVATYYDHVNGIAQDNAEAGSYIFLDPESQPLRLGLLKAFQWEPEGLAFRMLKTSYRIRDITFEGFRFDALRKQIARNDYWAVRMQSVVSRIAGLRLNRTKILQSEEQPRLEKMIEEIERR